MLKVEMLLLITNIKKEKKKEGRREQYKRGKDTTQFTTAAKRQQRGRALFIIYPKSVTHRERAKATFEKAMPTLMHC